MIHDPVECLQRLFPSEEDKVRVNRGIERLRQAKRIRLKSDNGTNVWFDKSDRPVFGQYGFAEEAGRWDHWPSAFQYTIPLEGRGDGTVVIDAGDVWYPPKRYFSAPVTMRFEKGVVVSIEGGARCRPHSRIHQRLARSGRLRNFTHRLGLASARFVECDHVPGSARHHWSRRAYRLREYAVCARRERYFRRQEYHRLPSGFCPEGAPFLPRR